MIVVQNLSLVSPTLLGAIGSFGLSEAMRPFPVYTTVPPPMGSTASQDIDPEADAPLIRRTGGGDDTTSASSRNRTHFYLPSPATNTDAALSRVSSRHYESATLSRRQSVVTGGGGQSSSLSMPASPSYASGSRHQLHRRSRTSLAGLRNALQTYQVPSEGDYGVQDPRTPSRYSPATTDRPISDLDLTYGAGAGLRVARHGHAGRALDYEHQEGYRGQEVLLRSPEGFGQEMMDALVEIHRVLYRGREDVQYAGNEQLQWDQQGQEVKRVVERWFEGDCSESVPTAAVLHSCVTSGSSPGVQRTTTRWPKSIAANRSSPTLSSSTSSRLGTSLL